MPTSPATLAAATITRCCARACRSSASASRPRSALSAIACSPIRRRCSRSSSPPRRASAGAASTRCSSTATRARGFSSARSIATCRCRSTRSRRTDAAPASAASTSARRRRSAGPYQLDARRCISYLTIEHKSAIPEELRPLIGNRVYGCDDCQLVCPWNRFAQPSAEDDFKPRNGLDRATLVELFAWTEAEFDERLQRLADPAHRLRALAAQPRGGPGQRPQLAAGNRGAACTREPSLVPCPRARPLGARQA